MTREEAFEVLDRAREGGAFDEVVAEYRAACRAFIAAAWEVRPKLEDLSRRRRLRAREVALGLVDDPLRVEEWLDTRARLF